MSKRLRIFDWNTPWFWLIIFYYSQTYGEPWFTISLWYPHQWQKWWIHIWIWESIPDKNQGYSVIEKEKEDKEIEK